MPNPSLDLKNITDLYVRNNFDQLQTFFKTQQQMLDFKFIDITFTGAETRRVFHGLGRVPVDLIRLSMVGSGVVTFDRSTFDNNYVVLSSTAACRVRFYAGSFPLATTRTNFDSTETEQWFSQAPAEAITGNATGIPPGGMIFWPSATLPNAATWGTWLWVDGSKKLMSAYPNLYDEIRGRYNTGGESGLEFRLPAPMGRVPLVSGAGSSLTSRTLGQTGGEETHLLISPEMPVHTHVATDSGHAHTVNTHNDNGVFPNPPTANISSFAPVTPTVTRATSPAAANVTNAPAGGGGAHNVMNPYFVLNFIIKA